MKTILASFRNLPASKVGARSRRTDGVAFEEPISFVVDDRQLAGWLTLDREVHGTGS